MWRTTSKEKVPFRPILITQLLSHVVKDSILLLKITASAEVISWQPKPFDMATERTGEMCDG